MIIDSKKRDKIENIRIMKLLVIELFFSIEGFWLSMVFILIRSVMCWAFSSAIGTYVNSFL